MSPTAWFSPVGVAMPVFSVEQGGEGVYPGWGMAGWVREGYTGTHPAPVPRTHIGHIPCLRPYPRPNKGKSEVFHEVSQIGSKNELELTQN